MTDIFKNLTDFSWMNDPQAWIGLVTLVALEVVLGIDNIVFISILTGKLPHEKRSKARQQGLILAVIPRVIFLLLLGLILGLEKPVFTLQWFEDPGAGHDGRLPGAKLGISGKDLVLIVGGLFLLVQAVREIHHKMEGDADELSETGKPGGRCGSTVKAVMIQIMFMNIIFSLDSIITAIGMTKLVPIMILAVLISTGVMMLAVNPVSSFVEKHPTVKMLALSFLLLIGTTLLIEALHFHIPKGYVYFAMAFSVFVELLNIRASRGKGDPVHLHPPA